MDGGLADSIPIQKSLNDKNSKHVLVLTRPKSYRKKRPHFIWVAHCRYPKYKGMCEAIESRHKKYNDTLDLIDEMENRGEVFVIRPQLELNIGRAERKKDKLYAAYDQGYADAAERYEALCSYLGGRTGIKLLNGE
jgi:predicted patatin/cPLA2 family phospholipase